MKVVIIVILIIVVSSIDVCVQQTTYDGCINLTDQQCEWKGQYCQKSNNYLMGCDPNLSQRLCVKQFGNMDGTTSECIFDTFCHTIYDKHITRCSSKLSKSGCLAITNPDELCKWENGQCQNLSVEEINNINQIFQDLELSASVCSRISGYLIIHSTLLWDLLSYKPDLFTEAQNLVKVEAGISVDTTKTYDDEKLGDNYVDNNGDYKWYLLPTQLSITNRIRY